MGVPVAFEAVHARQLSTYREDRAPAAVAELVACTWIGTSGWGRSIRVLPDGCCDLTFDGSALTVTTPAVHAIEVHLGHAQTTVGIRLRPERARTVLGDMRELGIGPIELEAVWEGSSRLMRRLTATGSPVVHRDLLIDEIARRSCPGPHHELLRHARLRLQRGHSLTAVASGVGMSERHLRREFTHAVGLSPKQFSRIARFQRALDLLRRQPTARFAAIAAAAGFVDEAHLARECRIITGGNLTALRHRIRPRPVAAP